MLYIFYDTNIRRIILFTLLLCIFLGTNIFLNRFKQEEKEFIITSHYFNKNLK